MGKITFEQITTREQCLRLKEFATCISREYFAPITGTEMVDYMMDKFLSPDVVMREISENYEFAFAFYDGDMAGYYAVAREGEALFLSKLYVHKSFRGKGIGSAMFDRIKSIAQGSRYIYLAVNKKNLPSLAIYKKWGFVIHESVAADIGGGFVMDDYVLRLYL